MDFIFNDGSTTGLPKTDQHVEAKLQNFDDIALIKMNGHHGDTELKGLQFFDKDQKLLL